MNFFHEGFLIFEQKVSDFQQKCSANLSTLHSTHPDSFSETKKFFWSNKSMIQFFSEVDQKSCRLWEESFQRSSFPEKISSEKHFLENCSWVFLDLEPKEFRTFANLFSMGLGVLERQSTCLEYPLEEN